MITWQDKWIAEDKAFHMSASFMAAAVLIWFLRWIGNDLRTGVMRESKSFRTGSFIIKHACPIACALVFLAGIALEWYQYSHGIDVFSFKDIAANTLGIIAAWGVMR